MSTMAKLKSAATDTIAQVIVLVVLSAVLSGAIILFQTMHALWGTTGGLVVGTVAALAGIFFINYAKRA